MPTHAAHQDDRAIVDKTVERCSRDFGPSVSQETVRAVVERTYGRFDDARVREFVPLLVERTVREELRQRVSDAN